MEQLHWQHNKVTGQYEPTLYPGDKIDNWEIPKEISDYYSRLNSNIEYKYSREFLKICAFYNKLFHSLRDADYTSVSYNTVPFTSLDQERSDTGTGENYNYLKEIIDHLTSRLGTVSFTPRLIAEEQTYEYIVYKDDVERILRSYIKKDSFNQTAMECFHDAAILCYSHALFDPYVKQLRKCSDFELGVFESELDDGNVKRCLYRNYNFPATGIEPYISHIAAEDQEAIHERIGTRTAVELSLYFDCVFRQSFVTIDGKTLPPQDYPFDTVLNG